MINRDPRCVFVADSLGLAEVVTVWLLEQGIPAQTMDTATLGGLEGLTWMSNTAVSSRGIEVWVLDEGQVSRANDLLKEHADALEAKAVRSSVSLVPILVACEDCGHPNTFARTEAGKVGTCAKCEAYIDVPSDEDEMGGFEEETGFKEAE